MKPSKLALILIVFLQATVLLLAQDYSIYLDEDYSDWDSFVPLYQDSIGDGADIDFGTFKSTSYKSYLFLYLEVGREINLQDLNAIWMYIDTDNDLTTGLQIKGIGADLQFSFGSRSGNYYRGTTNYPIYHDDLGFVSLPTVTSDRFELKIDTSIVIGGHKVFTSSSIKYVFIDDIFGGDQMPDGDGGIIYNFELTEPLQGVNYSIGKLNSNFLRIVSYNIERDNLFDPSRKEEFSRIIKALNPDIFGFQEIYNHSAEQTAELIEEFLPSNGNEQWYAAKQGSDIITVSRFPITQSFYVEGNGAFLVDLSGKYEKDLLLVNAHTPCCDNNDGRQREIDAFMAFVREAKKEGGELTLEFETPIVILGDMNLVGYKQQQTTLITGDIVNTGIFGEKFNPDWDGTDFMDSKPPTTHQPSTISWYNEGSSFAPGRLDYIVFTNSVIQLENSFVLFTNSLPQDSLDYYNLRSEDVTNASDHLPSVADFSLGKTVNIEDLGINIIPNKFLLAQNYPNPFNPSTIIKYEIPDQTPNDIMRVQIKVFDILGRQVAVLENSLQSAGSYEVQFNAKDLHSGVYFYCLRVGGSSQKSISFDETKMMMLLK